MTIEPALSKRGPATSEEIFVWRPPTKLASDFPADYQIAMRCHRTSMGFRWFSPVLPLNAFIHQAAAGGLALLSYQEKMSKLVRFSYRAMLLIYQQGHLFREHLSRRFNTRQDLMAFKLNYSGTQKNLHILPEGLGQNKQGGSWTPNELIRRGRDAANNPQSTTADHIRLGLLAAARLDPLDPEAITKPQALTLVQMALFDSRSTEAITPKQQELIESLFLETLEKHGNLSNDDFRTWFFGNYDHFVRAISKRKIVHLSMSREIVRLALLSMTMRAISYMGDCLHVQMRAFAKAIPVAFTPEEQHNYDADYCKQPYYGGLPLVLLRDRYPFVKEAIGSIRRSHGNPKHVGVFLRLLDYYAQMVQKRREYDRIKKSHNMALVYSLDEQRDLIYTGHVDHPAIDKLRIQHGIRCNCGIDGKWSTTLQPSADMKTIIVDDVCEVCEVNREWPIPCDQFRNTMRSKD